MKQLKKATIKRVFLGALLAVLLAVFGLVGFLTSQKPVEGEKSFVLEIISERDSYQVKLECDSDLDYLGEYLREQDFVDYEESSYGIYIHGFYDMMDDTDNQYWWCVIVNGEDSFIGADEIPLEDGSTYTFTLKQGW
jgi:hypothetical protein